MGFDEQKLEKLRGPMEDAGPRITSTCAIWSVASCDRKSGFATSIPSTYTLG